MALCTQAEWCAKNCQYQSWYMQEYPWLQMFPPNYEDLKSFYIWDMTNRNLIPLQSYINCYEFLLSYALENMPRVGEQGRFTGQTFWQRLIKDQWRNESILWTALKKTYEQGKGAVDWFKKLAPFLFAFLIIYAVKD
jgi:hypothetical protein